MIEETSKINYGELMNSYNDESDEGYFLEIDVQYPEHLHNLHNDLPFLPERMEIEKVEKVVPNLHDKTEYVTCDDVANSKLDDVQLFKGSSG